MSSETSVSDDRERYLRKMSDRLHDRFLERPAFLDIDFIRTEVKKLDSQIDEFLVAGQSWKAVVNRLGHPKDYADAVFAQRLLTPQLGIQGRRPTILMTVLKILFVVAPVNFIFAVGPLLLGFAILAVGWILSVVVVVAPLALIVHFAVSAIGLVGVSEFLLLIAIFCFGQLMALAMMTVSRLMIWAVWSWLGWNLAFLRAEPRR